MSDLPPKVTKLGQHRSGMIVDEKSLAKGLRAAKPDSTSSQISTAAQPTLPFLRSVENQIPISKTGARRSRKSADPEHDTEEGDCPPISKVIGTKAMTNRSQDAPESGTATGRAIFIMLPASN